ncbi:MAG: universal stress protein [Actinobacteria bacterium]|nr:MAG: universal stress protein [Actinomycetota bacterium]
MPETESMQTEGRAAPASPAPSFADILCAIDGKEGGFSAVEHAAALAGTQGRLTFLAVTSFRSGGAHRAPAIGPARASGILKRAEGIAREAGLPYASEVDPRSPPARVILDWSAKYDLLALGAPAGSWPARLLSVGVGNKALEGFTTALLVARPLAEDRRLGDRIVVASDGLEASHAVVDLAARLAHPDGSNVTLVHALGRESPIKRGRRRAQEDTLKEQEQTLTRTRASGTSELVVEPGRAADVIKSAAAAADASLVVMGSRRLDGLRAMGSVSRRVVHQARCSVLLVPPATLTR